jgi:peptidoglycan hydrolase-like protein with peptidoglycan-binding domain
MALQSRLFRGNPKLEGAAIFNPAHIVQGDRGPHVGKIQNVLIQVDRTAIQPDLVFGPATAAAVRAFKQKRQILNFEGRIDDIVGIKTMAALDREMLAHESTLGCVLPSNSSSQRLDLVGAAPKPPNRSC